MALFCLLVASGAWAKPPEAPYEVDAGFVPANRIDDIMLATWRKHGVTPAQLCSDEVFLRRVYLDLIGTLPTVDEVDRFLADARPGKRAVAVEGLFKRKEFADYWAMKWCDILRVKAEFPINLWPNAVQAYYRWVRDSLKENKPYDQFMRELLTSSGSNFRVPPVNFYRAMQGHEPATIARCVGLTMMGTRVEKWPEKQQQNLAAFFSRVAFKGTAEWKEEIVYLDPAPEDPLRTAFPDGQAVTIPAGTDPRRVFADWLIQPENPWFARAAVNRTWFWLFGRGIIHEADDIRDDNPPVVPELLAYLEKALVASRYDMRDVLRLIVNSRTYQQSSIPQVPAEDAATWFACYPVRRLDAEILSDALDKVFGSRETYSSPIPEPFTFVPENHPTVTLSDGSITSQFLEMFGRPSRDTGLLSERGTTPSEGQNMHLLNSSHIQGKIERSWVLKGLPRQARGDRQKLLRLVYVTILSRGPTLPEQVAVRDYFQNGGVNSTQAMQDLAWALVNSKEFLYRH
jgi:hypothetical protein